MNKKTAGSFDYDKAREALSEIFAVAETDAAANVAPEVPAGFAAAAATLFAASAQSPREAAIGSALVRLLNRQADLSLPYVGQGPTAYNGREVDQKVVNPFLHDRQVPASKGPYLAMFRRDWKFEPRAGVKDKAAYDALLIALSHFQQTNDDDEIRRLIRYLLIGFVKLRDASRVPLAKINRLNLDQYDHLFEALLRTQSGGLIPVLLTVAMFQTVKECFGLKWEISWQGINVADKASGVGGDISISDQGSVICAIEVTERLIDRSRVVSTFNSKISPSGIGDYMFVFTGVAPAKEAREAAGQYFGQGHDVNFIDIRPWLLNNLATLGSRCRANFTRNFLTLMDSKDVPAALKVKWNDLIKRLFG